MRISRDNQSIGYNPLRYVVKYSKQLFIPILLLTYSSFVAARPKIENPIPTSQFADVPNINSYTNNVPDPIYTNEMKNFVNDCGDVNSINIERYLTSHFHKLMYIHLGWCAEKAALANHENILKILQLRGFNFDRNLRSTFHTIVNNKFNSTLVSELTPSLELFLKYGADPNTHIHWGNEKLTILSISLQPDLFDITELLLRYKADIYLNVGRPKIWPLHFIMAMQSKAALYLNLILKYGFDVYKTLEQGDNALDLLASYVLSENTIEFRNSFYKELAQYPYTAALVDSVSEKVHIRKLLYDGKLFEKNNIRRFKHHASLGLEIRYTADIVDCFDTDDANKFSKFDFSTDIGKSLFHIDVKGLTIWHSAAQSNKFNLLKHMFNHRNELKLDIYQFVHYEMDGKYAHDTMRLDALSFACMRGNEEIVDFLLTNGYLKDAKKSHDRQLFTLAAVYGHENVMRILIKHHVKIQYKEIFDLYEKVVKSINYAKYRWFSTGFSMVMKVANNPNIYNVKGQSLLELTLMDDARNEFHQLINHRRIDLTIPKIMGEETLAVKVAVDKQNSEAIILLCEKKYDIYYKIGSGLNLIELIQEALHAGTINPYFMDQLAKSPHTRELVAKVNDSIKPVASKLAGIGIGSLLILLFSYLRFGSKSNVKIDNEAKTDLPHSKPKKNKIPKVEFPILNLENESINPLLERFTNQYEQAKKRRNSLEICIDNTTHLCSQFLKLEIMKEESRDKQRALLNKYKNECKAQDGEIVVLGDALARVEELKHLNVEEALTSLTKVEKDILELQIKAKTIEEALDEQKLILNHSIQTIEKHKEKSKLTVPKTSAVSEVKETKENKETATDTMVRLRHAPRKFVEKRLSLTPVQTVFDFPPTNTPDTFFLENKPIPNNLKIWLNEAFIHLIHIGFIQLLNAEDLDAEIRHYALIYNIFRCFHSLKCYMDKGGDVPTIFDSSIADIRNMIIHGGANIASEEKVIATAIQLTEHMPQQFLDMKKTHLYESALSEQQRKDLVSAFKMGDARYQSSEFQLVIDQTPLYTQLRDFHQNITNNNQKQIDLLSLIKNKYMPLLQRFMLLINPKGLPVYELQKQMTFEDFASNFLFELQALRMVVTICGELNHHLNLTKNHHMRIFMDFSREMRNLTGHQKTDNVLGWDFYARLFSIMTHGKFLKPHSVVSNSSIYNNNGNQHLPKQQKQKQEKKHIEPKR